MSFDDAHQLVMFIAAGWLLNLTPGPMCCYIVTNALKSGTRAGIVAGLGITAGCFVHIFAPPWAWAHCCAASGHGVRCRAQVDRCGVPDGGWVCACCCRA